MNGTGHLTWRYLYGIKRTDVDTYQTTDAFLFIYRGDEIILYLECVLRAQRITPRTPNASFPIDPRCHFCLLLVGS